MTCKTIQNEWKLTDIQLKVLSAGSSETTVAPFDECDEDCEPSFHFTVPNGKEITFYFI